MGALKGFSWLEVCFYIQSGLILKRLPLYTTVSRNVASVFEILLKGGVSLLV